MKMVNCEVNIRNEFFISALFVENMISSYITTKFKLNGIIDTSILDNTDESISFNDKIELLLESDDLSIIDKSKISVFREIYKELNINKDAETFEDCLTSSDSNDDFLLILYPQEDTITREKKLTNACILLIDDVSQLVSSFTKETPVKLNKRISKLYPLIMGGLSFVFSILLFR
jgi:hypothetical protein